VLVPLLFGEAQIVKVQMRLVSANIVQRLHRKKYQDQVWKRYEEEITTNQLLRTASHITGLGPSERPGDDYLEDDF